MAVWPAPKKESEQTVNILEYQSQMIKLDETDVVVPYRKPEPEGLVSNFEQISLGVTRFGNNTVLIIVDRSQAFLDFAE